MGSFLIKSRFYRDDPQTKNKQPYLPNFLIRGLGVRSSIERRLGDYAFHMPGWSAIGTRRADDGNLRGVWTVVKLFECSGESYRSVIGI